MRIANGPRLAIPRGLRFLSYGVNSGMNRWWRNDRLDDRAYHAQLADRRTRIRQMTSKTAGDRKQRRVIPFYVAQPGLHYRQVDGHGRCFGPRLTSSSALPSFARVRRVERQEEDLRSQLIRMLNRAHRLAT